MAIRVIHFGLGPIGCAIVRQVAEREGFMIVGGIDVDPAKVGRDIGQVAGLGRDVGAPIWSDATTAFSIAKPDVAVLCTSSSLSRVAPQIEFAINAKVAVVSTTEELVYATAHNHALLQKIDALARKAGVAVLATGINPGFAMDTLPIFLTGVCQEVRSVQVNRVQNAAVRRLPFQQKIGAGLTVEQFEARVQDGTVRHVGLAESVQMIADAMGWTLDRIVDDIKPKIADTRVASDQLAVEAGLACGIIQDGAGYVRGRATITLHMEAYLGCPESYDAVKIDGSPSLDVKIAGGIHGDIATGSIVVNSIPKVLAAEPGYRTMRDLPIPSFFRGNGFKESFRLNAMEV